jgi:hypothetical protein
MVEDENELRRVPVFDRETGLARGFIGLSTSEILDVLDDEKNLLFEGDPRHLNTSLPIAKIC